MTFEKGVEIVFKWIAMFSTIGEWCVILLRELLTIFLKEGSQQTLTVIQLETCLALPFHSEPIGKEDSLQAPWDDFHVFQIPPDTFESWLSACESAAGIVEENILPVEVIVPQDIIVLEDSVQTPLIQSNGLLPSPKRIRTPYVPNPRKKPQKLFNSSGKGFG